ncbi:hypothetical protein GGI35DRAFT_482853 [Trichoderma velutinum]
MACQTLDTTSGICFGNSNNITLLLASLKHCCGPAPIVQYYSNSTGCGAYCPIVPNSLKGDSLVHCLVEALGNGACFEPLDVATPSVVAQASAREAEPVCSACAAAAATSTNAAAIGVYSADTASWKTGLTIGAILFTKTFAGFFI